MKPLVGTVWLTGTGRTQKSPTRCSTSSSSGWNRSTGACGLGSLVKSGHTVSLKIEVRSAVDHRLQADDRQGRRRLAQRQRLGQVGEAGDVIEVRVGDERVLDRELLGTGQRTADGAAVDQDSVVEQEGGRPLRESLGSIRAEHSDLHSSAIVA